VAWNTGDNLKACPQEMKRINSIIPKTDENFVQACVLYNLAPRIEVSMEELIQQLLCFGKLDHLHIELIKSKCEVVQVKKGTYFLKAGRVVSRVGYITEGILRVGYDDPKGEDTTRYFITENHFAADIKSFLLQTPSTAYFEALTDCSLLTFSVADFALLGNAIPCWNDIFSKLTAAYLAEKVRISRELLTLDAKSRYLLFLDYFPGLANRVPLSSLASFLGITRSSLSRIRKNIC